MNRMILSGLLSTTILVASGCGKPFAYDPNYTGAGGSGGETPASSSNSGGQGSSGSTGGAGGEIPDAGRDVQCIPLICEDFGYNCGKANDGCGGTIFCGQCAEPDSCGGGSTSNPGKPNICGLTACAGALEDPSGILGVAGQDLVLYQAVVDCVCHNGQTTTACSFDQGSQDMCAQEEVTWDFLVNDPIGPCVRMACAAVITTCENDGAP